MIEGIDVADGIRNTNQGTVTGEKIGTFKITLSNGIFTLRSNTSAKLRLPIEYTLKESSVGENQVEIRTDNGTLLGKFVVPKAVALHTTSKTLDLQGLTLGKQFAPRLYLNVLNEIVKEYKLCKVIFKQVTENKTLFTIESEPFIFAPSPKNCFAYNFQLLKLGKHKLPEDSESLMQKYSVRFVSPLLINRIIAVVNKSYWCYLGNVMIENIPRDKRKASQKKYVCTTNFLVPAELGSLKCVQLAIVKTPQTDLELSAKTKSRLLYKSKGKFDWSLLKDIPYVISKSQILSDISEISSRSLSKKRKSASFAKEKKKVRLEVDTALPEDSDGVAEDRKELVQKVRKLRGAMERTKRVISCAREKGLYVVPEDAEHGKYLLSQEPSIRFQITTINGTICVKCGEKYRELGDWLNIAKKLSQ